MITFLENACDKINMRKKETYYEHQTKAFRS